MSDIKKFIDNPDTSGPHSEREIELQDWNEEQGRRNAEIEGIELTDAHWEVVHSLREYYLEHGQAKNGRELSKMLENKYMAQGGSKYLRQLFPKGPVAQGMHIAGLEVPPHTRDDGFGISL